MIRLPYVPFLLFCTILMIAGCAQPPAEQMSAAEQAVKDAQQSGAATYVPDEYAKLEGTLSAMKKEVADQEAKFALFRDYGKVEQLAATAKAEADRVKGEAVKKMDEAKSAAVQAHRDAQEAVKKAMDLVAKAPTGKDRAALESIKTDAEALKASLNDVQMMIDKSDYPAAKTKADAIREKSLAVSHEIETALAKVSKAKPVSGKKK
ncbi:MAG TPA: hypothetical protein VJ746_18745 [Nitrospira sp.]|nr:hypothetical protein [Nitrospira sp.]